MREQLTDIEGFRNSYKILETLPEGGKLGERIV
jgi:hypothetical protein